MKLNLKKETLVILSNDTHSLPADLTPQVAGGNGGTGGTGGLFTSYRNCGDGQTSAGCTSLAGCSPGPAITVECLETSVDYACKHP